MCVYIYIYVYVYVYVCMYVYICICIYIQLRKYNEYNNDIMKQCNILAWVWFAISKAGLMKLGILGKSQSWLEEGFSDESPFQK